MTQEEAMFDVDVFYSTFEDWINDKFQGVSRKEFLKQQIESGNEELILRMLDTAWKLGYTSGYEFGYADGE